MRHVDIEIELRQHVAAEQAHHRRRQVGCGRQRARGHQHVREVQAADRQFGDPCDPGRLPGASGAMDADADGAELGKSEAARRPRRDQAGVRAGVDHQPDRLSRDAGRDRKKTGIVAQGHARHLPALACGSGRLGRRSGRGAEQGRQDRGQAGRAEAASDRCGTQGQCGSDRLRAPCISLSSA